MIALHSDALVFQTTHGDLVPCSVQSVVVELIGDSQATVDPALIQQAAQAVLHYFRKEKGQSQVTVAEFAEALARVLRSFGLEVSDTAAERPSTTPASPTPSAPGTDLRTLLGSAPDKGELFFFSKLRADLRTQLARSPEFIRFSGLRGCVKQLTGARRWSRRCQKLQDQIVTYLRCCLDHEAAATRCTLVVR
jgi:hypothetical protein